MGTWHLWIQNVTQGWTFSTTQTPTAMVPSRMSAEWIVECPLNGRPGPPFRLADFGTVTFTHASVNVGASNLKLRPGARVHALEMIRGIRSISVPGELGANGGFSVKWGGY